MKRLPNVLPDWTRVQWTNIENKEKYEPIIVSASQAWKQIRRMSVVHDLRLSHMEIIKKDELQSLINEYTKYGVIVAPIAKEPITRTYFTKSYELRDYDIRVVFTKSENVVSEWYNIWNGVDKVYRNTRAAELLGYPQCCIAFNKIYRNKEKFVDTTWPMATNGIDSVTDETTLIHIKADTPPECNVLWRWQNIQLIEHNPCSFDCKHSTEIGIRNAELGRMLGYNKEIDDIYELLSWPVEWSALHGIAEIRTPINKISSRTDMTPWKYSVQKQSHSYPEDGASGITYPYNQKKIKIKPVTKTISFAKSLEDTSIWEENGFRYKEAMDHFHEVIIEAIGDMKYIPAGNVLDLGCGNGVLLGRVVGNRHDLLPHGVEADRQRCMSAATTIHWGVFTMGDIFDLSTWKEPAYSLVLLMPGRLLETTKTKAAAFRKQLYDKTDLILINLTSDWTQQYGSIESIMKISGLSEEWEPAGKLVHRQDDMAQLFKRKV